MSDNSFYPFKPCNYVDGKAYGKRTWLVTPKIDGIRAVCRDAICNKYRTKEAMFTVQGKRVANNHIRTTLGEHISLLQGFDGELGGLKPTNKSAFKTAVTLVQTINAISDNWRWYVFNYFGDGSKAYCSKPFSERWADAKEKWSQLPEHIQEHVLMLEPVAMSSLASAKEYAESLVKLGYEGAIFTVPEAPYLYKRNVVSDPWSLRYKPFDFLEARIVGFKEAHYSYGKTVPKDKQGKPKGELGALILEAPGFKSFDCGTGFTSQERRDFWANQEHWLGRVVRVSYLPAGTHDRPRSPSFKGERPIDDLDREHPLLTKLSTETEQITAGISEEPLALAQAITHVQNVCMQTLGDGNRQHIPSARRITNWYNNPNKTLQAQLEGHLQYWLSRS